MGGEYPEMERKCFLLKIKNQLAPEYMAAHKAVPAELLRAMREVGIRNYSLFLGDDGLVIGYLEAENVEQSLSRLEKTDASRIWEESVARYFESGSGDFGADSMSWPEQIFYMD
jgi:L-rhamnose mutarotase